jgi:hypothetical protein
MSFRFRGRRGVRSFNAAIRGWGRLSHMKWHLIRDIRCYLDDVLADQPAFYAELGKIVQRYWGKLRELGFRTPGYHHVYLTLCQNSRHGNTKITPFFEWCANIKVGISPLLVNPLPEREKHDFLVTFVAGSLKALCDRDGLDFSKVQKAENLLLEHRTELECVHLLKETTRYRVLISFQLYPNGGPSIAFLEYTDKIANRTGRSFLTELVSYGDLYWIAQSVTVKNGLVQIKPRTSCKARFWSEPYKVPYEFRVADMLKSSRGSDVGWEA